MQIKNKYYTYPVIAPGNDSYVDSEFLTDANYIRDAHNIRFNLTASLTDKCLLEMITTGGVKYAHHIECPQTCFRELRLTDQDSYEFVVHESKLNGIVQICSFLMSTQAIPNYSNPSFGTDYRGFKFNIDRGCVLAIGNQINILINKEKENLANTSSIFSIQKNFDPSVTELKINTSDKKKIVILIPERTCSQYLNVGTSALMPVLHAMVIQPALMQVLYELRESSQRSELYMYENFHWYISLKRIAEKNEINFDENALATINVFSTVQKLLDGPIIKGMDIICSGEEGFDD